MREESIRLLIAGGGTGGHLFPALALAEEFKRQVPEGEVLFVGTARGLEVRKVPQSGYRLELIDIGGIKGKGLWGWIKGLLRLPRALWQSRRILRAFRPQLVVGVGGYASAPVVLAAWMARLPVLIMEQNALPGFTNRVLGRLARKVVVAFPQAAAFFAPGKAELLGNPVRSNLQPRSDAHPVTEPHLLVVGGSQGARVFNQLLPQAAPAVVKQLPGLRIRHQTGPAERDQVEESYRQAGISAEVLAFIDDMAGAYAWADLVLCRAGATTVAELAAVQKPALLVPFPFAADDHQTKNARALKEAGAARVLPQANLTVESLAAELIGLLSNPPRLQEMSRAAASVARPQAAREICSLCLRLAGGKA